jgi:hypothetical protein
VQLVPSVRTIQRYATSVARAATESDHLPYRLVQVDVPHSNGSSSARCAAGVSLAGALVVASDVSENFPDSSRFGEELFNISSAVSVLVRMSPGLVQFMRDGGRQFAGSRIAVEVCKLRQALARLDLGETAPAALMEQSADQPPWIRMTLAISDICQLYLSHMPGSAKQNLAPRRQVALVDAPTLHLSPIEFGERNQSPEPDIAGLPAKMRMATDGV